MARAPHTYAKDHLSGEERLWHAVLGQALREATGPDPRLRARAFEWIERRNRRPGGFEWVCHVLGLGAQRLRVGVRQRRGEANLRWEERDGAAHAAQMTRSR